MVLFRMPRRKMGVTALVIATNYEKYIKLPILQHGLQQWWCTAGHRDCWARRDWLGLEIACNTVQYHAWIEHVHTTSKLKFQISSSWLQCKNILRYKHRLTQSSFLVTCKWFWPTRGSHLLHSTVRVHLVQQSARGTGKVQHWSQSISLLIDAVL